MTQAGSFEERFRTLETLETDAESAVLLVRDGQDGKTTLVRRLNDLVKKDEKAKGRLAAEAEYTDKLECKRCPRAELITFGDGEQVLRYVHGNGVTLARLLDAFENTGRMLSPAAATVIVSEILHAAKAIQRARPPAAVGVSSWGHGEIDTTGIVVGEDGLARLYDTRLACSGFRAEGKPEDRACRAPELSETARTGTPTGDVFAAGGLLALCTLGTDTLAPHTAEELRDAVERKISTIGPAYDDGFGFVVMTALAPIARERFENASVMRIALRQCAYVDEDKWAGLKRSLGDVVKALSDASDLDQVPAWILDANPGLTLPPFSGDSTANETRALDEPPKTVTNAQAVTAPQVSPSPSTSSSEENTAVQFRNPFIDAERDMISLPGRDSVPDTELGTLDPKAAEANTQSLTPAKDDTILSMGAQDVLKEISERKLSPVWGDKSIPPVEQRREPFPAQWDPKLGIHVT